MGLAGAGAADEDGIALAVEEVAGGQVADQGLVDLGGVEGELVELLGQRQLGDGHLVFDRSRLLLADLRRQQIADDALRLVPAFDGAGHDLVKRGPHSVELQLPHGVQHFGAFHRSVSSSCHIGCNRPPAR